MPAVLFVPADCGGYCDGYVQYLAGIRLMTRLASWVPCTGLCNTRKPEPLLEYEEFFERKTKKPQEYEI